MENKSKVIVAFGGGCFWCTEAVFLELKGVTEVTPGYAGGGTLTPTYGAVSSGKTGHAEVIQIEYDPSVIPFQKLLEVFFSSHDPTALNRQGNDVGTQYRSILLYTTPEQKSETEEYIKRIAESKKNTNPVVTEVIPLTVFYPAEEYHKNYFAKHPDESYSEAIIAPKIEKVRREYSELLKD